MITKSVRFRLTALYSSTLIFSLIILFASFFWITRRELYDHTDIALRSHGSRIITILSTEDNTVNTQISSQLLTEVFNETPGMLAFVTDSKGTVLTVSQGTNSMQEKIRGLFNKIKNNKDPVYINESIGTERMRFVLIPITNDGQLRNVIMVGHPIDVIEKSLGSLTGNLIIIFLAFVLPTIFGGYVLAGSALRPVEEISRDMETISSENLKRRVMVPETDDEIAHLARTFNTLLDRLEGAFSRERQFIGDIAHELKTPLATLSSAIEVAQAKKRTVKEMNGVLDELLIDANRLSRTLSNILDLAWTTTEPNQSARDTTNISGMLMELGEIAQKLSYTKKIQVKFTIADHIMIAGKKDKLFRALLNIIDNAVKYTKENGLLFISLKSAKNKARITIKDTGKGITPDDIPHIFDRFYRGAKTDKTHGSGLGLAIAHAVITSYGGTIDVQSTVGKGTTFNILLPLVS